MQHRLVGREHQRVLAKTRVLAEFVGEQELIEDARRHQDGFAQAHGQRENVVGVGSGALAQLGEDGLILLFAFQLHERQQGALPPAVSTGRLEFGEHPLILRPLLKQLVDVGVVTKFLEENVDFQRLELRLTQKGIGPQFRIVEIQHLLRQLLVPLTDRAAVFGVEFQQGLKEGEILPDRLLALSHFRFRLPMTRKADR